MLSSFKEKRRSHEKIDGGTCLATAAEAGRAETKPRLGASSDLSQQWEKVW